MEMYTLNLFRGLFKSFVKLRLDFSLCTSRKTQLTPSSNRVCQENFLISERSYLEYLLEHLLLFLKSPEVCGFGNKGMNLMNYVALSGIYRIRDEAYVFGEIIVNPPGLSILSSNWSSSWSLVSFTEMGSWEWSGESLRLFFVDSDFGFDSCR